MVVVPLQPGMEAELTAAMRGSAGAFLMTPPIVKVPPTDDEFTLGQELANAAVAAGVEHVVFSGLENVEARTGGTKHPIVLKRVQLGSSARPHSASAA